MTSTGLIVSANDSPVKLKLGQEKLFGKLGPIGQSLFDFGTSRVIGQDAAWLQLAQSVTVHNSGIRLQPHLPISQLLFAGPPGSGKTMSAIQFSRWLIDPTAKRAPLTRIACSKLKSPMQMTELFGSSKGYVGSQKLPMLSQLRIDGPHFWAKVRQNKDALNLYSKAYGKSLDYLNGLVAELYVALQPIFGLMLWDEIEKANDEVWELLLNILGDGELAMSGDDGTVTDFRNTFHIFTSNVGSRALRERSGKRSYGPVVHIEEDDVAKSHEQCRAITLEAAEKIFQPEFMDRIRDSVVIFNELTKDDVRRAVAIRYAELKTVMANRKGGSPEVFFTPELTDYLVDLGFSKRRGMRLLDHVFKERVVTPLSTMLEDQTIGLGQTLVMTVTGEKTELSIGKSGRSKVHDERVVRIFDAEVVAA